MATAPPLLGGAPLRRPSPTVITIAALSIATLATEIAFVLWNPYMNSRFLYCAFGFGAIALVILGARRPGMQPTPMASLATAALLLAAFGPDLCFAVPGPGYAFRDAPVGNDISLWLIHGLALGALVVGVLASGGFNLGASRRLLVRAVGWLLLALGFAMLFGVRGWAGGTLDLQFNGGLPDMWFAIFGAYVLPFIGALAAVGLLGVAQRERTLTNRDASPMPRRSFDFLAMLPGLTLIGVGAFGIAWAFSTRAKFYALCNLPNRCAYSVLAVSNFSTPRGHLMLITGVLGVVLFLVTGAMILSRAARRTAETPQPTRPVQAVSP